MTGKNQGEGDRESARRYNEDSQEFVETRDEEKLAREAEPQGESEAAELEEAREEGAARARENDPDETRERNR